MLKALTQKPLLGAIGSVVVVLVLLGLWKIPQWQVAPLQKQIDALQSSGKPADPEKIAPLEKSRLDAENASRTVLVQGVGGLLVFATIFISWRNLRATQEKQVADRFSKAVEQLGSENIHARLGGIYALEQIAKDAEEKYYWQVMETLTSYVRERSPYPPKATKKHSSFVQMALETIASNETQSDEEIPPLAIDIQAVMTVITRRDHSYGHPLEQNPLDLHGADLRQVQLPPKTQLSHANLAKTNLQEAKLEGINLQEAYLGDALLKDAVLRRANLQKANLVEANLQKANLMEANLQETNLQGANLQEAELVGANLQKAKLIKVNLQRAQLSEANLQEAVLHSSNLQEAVLERANLQKAKLQEVNLQNADLDAANLQEANLGGANLQEAKLLEANLQKAFLSGANLRKAFLIETNLQEVNLRGADLQEATLYNANLQGAKLLKVKLLRADLYGANLQNSLELTWQQLNQAASYEGAILPDYLSPRSPQVEMTQSAKQAIEPVQAEGETE